MDEAEANNLWKKELAKPPKDEVEKDEEDALSN